MAQPSRCFWSFSVHSTGWRPASRRYIASAPDGPRTPTSSLLLAWPDTPLRIVRTGGLLQAALNRWRMVGWGGLEPGGLVRRLSPFISHPSRFSCMELCAWTSPICCTDTSQAFACGGVSRRTTGRARERSHLGRLSGGSALLLPLELGRRHGHRVVLSVDPLQVVRPARTLASPSSHSRWHSQGSGCGAGQSGSPPGLTDGRAL